MAHMKTLPYRNRSHQEYQTLEGELLKIELLGSQRGQGLGRYSYYGQTTGMGAISLLSRSQIS